MRRVITFTTPMQIAAAVAHTDLSRNHIRWIRVILVSGSSPERVLRPSFFV